MDIIQLTSPPGISYKTINSIIMDMKKFSLSGFKPARGFTAPMLAKGLLLVSLMFMQACSSEDVPADDAQPMRISADIEKPASRAMNRNTSFVTGDEIGLMMDDGSATSYDAYTLAACELIGEVIEHLSALE